VADLLKGADQDRVAGDRSHDRVVRPRPSHVGDEEVEPVDQRFDRPEALEVAVEVDASESKGELESEEIAPLDRRAEPLVRLGATQPLGKVVLGPEPELPPRMVVEPRLLVTAELGRERSSTDPDLVEDAWDEQSQGCDYRDAAPGSAQAMGYHRMPGR
jgi:hypothetical protein